MKKLAKLKSLLVVPALVLGVAGGALVVPSAVGAQELTIGGGADAAQGSDQEGTCLFTGPNCNEGIFTIITNVLLFIIGAIAVIMLIIGGLRYVVSGGDQAAVTSAKNTILYAVVGIIVAILAYAVVNFVVGSFVNN